MLREYNPKLTPTMKLLNIYDTEAIAYIDKGFLENNGIPAFVEQNAMSSVFPAPDSGTSSIGLFVDDDRYEDAKRLLDFRQE